MTWTWGPELYYVPEYWPEWLKVLAVITLLALAGVVVHGLLRIILGKKINTGEEPHKFYLYILPVRVWHWLNALFFIVLLITGLLGHFSIGNTEWMVKIHKFTSIVYVALWLSFIIISIITGNFKYYCIHFAGMPARVYKQAMYYLIGIMKGEPHPYETTVEQKFNPIQQLTYVGVVFMLLPLIILTGLGALFGHSAIMLKIHLALGVFGLIFLIIHLYMCTTGDRPLYLIKGMIDGYHRNDEEQHK